MLWQSALIGVGAQLVLLLVHRVTWLLALRLTARRDLLLTCLTTDQLTRLATACGVTNTVVFRREGDNVLLIGPAGRD